MKDYKKMLGITLIALVITIVVLIILATVIINLSLGENGLFERSREAKEQYLNASQYEEEQITKNINEIDNIVYNRQGSNSAIPSIDYENGIDLSSVLNSTNATYTALYNGYIYIYAGKNTSTNGFYELNVTKNNNVIDKVFFQDRTSSSCHFTDHIIVNQGVTLTVIGFQDINYFNAVFYPFK